MFGRRGLIAVLGTAACSFAGEGSSGGGSHGLGQGGEDMLAEDGGESDGEDSGENGNAADNGGEDGSAGVDSEGGAGSSAGEDGNPPPNDDGPGTPARLEINGGVGFAFDTMAPDAIQSVVLEVQNVGGDTATAIVPLSLDASFAYSGGFPGSAGTCGPTLDAGGACLIEVSYVPKAWGSHSTALTLSYEGGDWDAAEVPIAGVCGGTSDNLLTNPSFEQGLQGWTPSPSSWTTVQGGAPDGNYVAFAGSSGNTTFTLRQSVVVAQWAELIDDGALQVITAGSHRADGWYNDPNRYRLVFRDGTGGDIGTHSSSENHSSSWSQFNDAPIVPAGTRTVEFVAVCTKYSGDTCNASFDAVGLRGRFPPQ